MSGVSELSTPSAASMACSIYVCYLYLVHSVYIYSVYVFYSLLRLHPQFYHFHCKLYRITMTCFISHRKVDDFKTSAFSVAYLLSMPLPL